MSERKTGRRRQRRLLGQERESRKERKSRESARPRRRRKPVKTRKARLHRPVDNAQQLGVLASAASRRARRVVAFSWTLGAFALVMVCLNLLTTATSATTTGGRFWSIFVCFGLLLLLLPGWIRKRTTEPQLLRAQLRWLAERGLVFGDPWPLPVLRREVADLLAQASQLAAPSAELDDALAGCAAGASGLVERLRALDERAAEAVVADGDEAVLATQAREQRHFMVALNTLRLLLSEAVLGALAAPPAPVDTDELLRRLQDAAESVAAWR